MFDMNKCDGTENIKVKISYNHLSPENIIKWKELISSEFLNISGSTKDYLEHLTEITLIISKSTKTFYKQIYSTIDISSDRCIKCSGKFHTTNGTMCYKHLIEVLKTNSNPILSWEPGSFMSGGYAVVLCGCMEDLSCCAGIGGYAYQCELHDDRTYLDALMNH